MKIALFHYHLKPGGVTDVVVFSVRALLSRMDDLSEIRLVTGSPEGTEAVMDKIRDGLDRQTSNKLKLDVLEELAYVEDGEGPEAAKLAERLEARYAEDTLWWIHNYHLGKNTAFTAAVVGIAEAGKRDMLLQIHDFPECGRHENLRRLDEDLPVPPYPSGPRVRYAVINERDRKILADAGLGEAVSLLADPVSLPPPAMADQDGVRKALEEKCAKDNPAYVAGAPLILYPIRAIRRKNVLEAALIVRLLDEPANLIVTLPGISAQETAYSDMVEGAYRDGLITGVWCPEATGDERLAYERLTASCDAVISTSVQEGFGYLFLNALHWRKPLLARYLDILDGVLELFGDYPRRFWADFRVPDRAGLFERTRAAYEAKIRGLSPPMPEKSMKSISSAIAKMTAGGGIDVSFLGVEDQLEMLRLAKDDAEWLEETRLLNKELLESIERTLVARPPDMDRTIEAHFGEGSYARRFREITASFGAKVPTPSPAKVRESVSKAFGRIDYMRLIYD